VQTSANPTTSIENMESGLDSNINTASSPLHTFYVPEGLAVVAEGISEELLDSLPSPIWSPPRPCSLVEEHSTTTVQLSKPLHHERIEMAIIWYKRTKQAWLAQNPHVHPTNYQKARGFEKVCNIQQYLHHLPKERRLPNGEIVEHETIWTEEEILAWLQYQELLENILANKIAKSINREGLSTDIVKLSYLNKAIKQ